MLKLFAGLSVVGVFLLVIFLGPILGAICWPYVINHWLVYFDKDPVVLWWQGALMGLVPGIGQFCIPAAILTWILMLFL